MDDLLVPLWGLLLPGGDWRNLRHVLPDGNAIWIGPLFASVLDFAIVVATALLVGRVLARRIARRGGG